MPLEKCVYMRVLVETVLITEFQVAYIDTEGTFKALQGYGDDSIAGPEILDVRKTLFNSSIYKNWISMKYFILEYIKSYLIVVSKLF